MNRYHEAIEEIVTINELNQWIKELNDTDINDIVRNIDCYYKLEMNLDLKQRDTDCMSLCIFSILSSFHSFGPPDKISTLAPSAYFWKLARKAAASF